jgi:hypothetical protein
VVQLVSHSAIIINTHIHSPHAQQRYEASKESNFFIFLKLIIIHLSFITPSGDYCCTCPSLKSNA